VHFVPSPCHLFAIIFVLINDPRITRDCKRQLGFDFYVTEKRRRINRARRPTNKKEQEIAKIPVGNSETGNRNTIPNLTMGKEKSISNKDMHNRNER
jgi:hypothetical protein